MVLAALNGGIADAELSPGSQAVAQGHFNGSGLAGFCLSHAAGLRRVSGPSKGHPDAAATFSTGKHKGVNAGGQQIPRVALPQHGSPRAHASSARQR